MADVTDIADLLVAAVAGAVYPAGTGQPPAGGVQAQIYQGWPDPNALMASFRQQVAHVTVFPTTKVQITTRGLTDWQEMTPAAPTMTAAVTGTSITLGGTVSLPQAVALIVDGRDFAYGVQAGDSLTSIAAALAAMVSVVQPANSVGAVISIPGAHTVVARIVSTGTSAKEVAREKRIFTVSIWADCHERREALAKVITPVLADLLHLAPPDGSAATSEYGGSQQVDSEQKQGIYRRDISLSIEYATLLTRTDSSVAIIQTRPAVVVGATVVPLPVINQ